MELTPQELMKQYVDSQNFTSTTQIMQAMKELFRDVIQQVMESELDVELGYEKSERMSDSENDNLLRNYRNVRRCAFQKFIYSLTLITYQHCNKRNDLTSGTQECRKFEKSERQIRYYIRLTNLVLNLLDKVDAGSISIKAGVELSYLDVKAQETVNEFLETELCNVSEKQAKEIRANFEQGSLSYENLKRILCDEKEEEKFYLDTKRLRSYFPKSYSLKECKEAVWRILENWFKRKKGDIDGNN